MKRMIIALFVIVFLMGLIIWLDSRDDNRRMPAGTVAFESLPTPKLEALQKQLYEQWQKEAAEKEASIIAEKKFAGNKKK